MKVWILLLVISISTNAVAQCDFVTADYIEEMTSPYQVKSINVEVAKSSKFAKNAIKILEIPSYSNIPPKLKKKFDALVRVEFSFGSCLYRAKIRQSGDWKDHIILLKGYPLQSLDVKLLDGNIVKATRFKLLIPKTRNGKHEILATLILKELDFITPETFEVNVDINGVQSVMLFQEKSAKELLERRSRREGPIFEGDETLIWSYPNYENFELEPLALARLINDNWFDKGSSSQKIVLEAFKRLQKSYLDYAHTYLLGENSMISPNLRANKIFANYQNVLLAMNGLHALRPHNQKYFFNSIERYFEPIYYDGNVSFSSLNMNEYKNRYELLPNTPSNDFNIRALKLISSDSLRKNFIERTSLDSSNEDFYFQSMKQFKKNLITLKSAIKTETENDSSSKKSLHNYSWYRKFQTEKKVDQNIIIQVNIEKLTPHLLLDDGSSLEISITDLSKILAKNSLKGERFVILPRITTDVTENEYKDIKVGTKIIRVSKSMDVRFDESNKQIEFIQSNPKDWALLSGDDYSNWNLVFRGIKSHNVSTNSEIQRFNALGLTGCLTLYKTKINNTRITISNGECEDSVNFIRSFGEGLIISVIDSFADAVDADFSQLTISDLEVVNAGNDCLDVSSGNYLLDNAKFSNCKDKAISVGEMSTFQGDNISINKANIGVSSKDFSQTIINNLNLKEVVLCGESKRKKQEFGGASLSIINNNCATSFEHDNESIIFKGNS